MKARSGLGLSLAILALFLASSVYAEGRKEHWTSYAIDESLTIRYPASWWPVSIERGRIDIRSSKQGAEGVGIGRGQAEIIASVQDIEPMQTLDQLIQRNVRNDEVLSDRPVDFSRSRVGQSCTNVREVISRNEIGPNTFVINTGIFCQIDNTLIIVLLRTWGSEERLREYQHIAEDISKSIERSGS